MVWQATPEQRAKISAAMRGRKITWGAKISAALRAGNIVYPTVPLADRFWAKVDTSAGPDACWPWTAALDVTGYGVMYVKRGTLRRKGYAHRVSYELHHGPIPAGMEILHACDNRPCVNPRHLSADSHTANVRDASAKGRMKKRPVTHCKSGHEFTLANTRMNPNGSRGCRTCARETTRRYRARQVTS